MEVGIWVGLAQQELLRGALQPAFCAPDDCSAPESNRPGSPQIWAQGGDKGGPCGRLLEIWMIPQPLLMAFAPLLQSPPSSAFLGGESQAGLCDLCASFHIPSPWEPLPAPAQGGKAKSSCDHPLFFPNGGCGNCFGVWGPGCYCSRRGVGKAAEGMIWMLKWSLHVLVSPLQPRTQCLVSARLPEPAAVPRDRLAAGWGSLSHPAPGNGVGGKVCVASLHLLSSHLSCLTHPWLAAERRPDCPTSMASLQRFSSVKAPCSRHR